MASTFTITYLEDDTINKKCGHNFKMITGKLVFTTYDAGTTTTGMLLDLSNAIPTQVHFVTFDNPGGYSLVYDYTNKKVRVYYCNLSYATDGLHEVPDGVSLATPLADVKFLAIGK